MGKEERLVSTPGSKRNLNVYGEEYISPMCIDMESGGTRTEIESVDTVSVEFSFFGGKPSIDPTGHILVYLDVLLAQCVGNKPDQLKIGRRKV
ncbi:unnamed protein product [Larinioides sclopetarius]|uniref:Uncharacterized protein n=1 Tax=Larinioides sclopetarius TaxID=280406 RepID=A0AAV2B931_9ARAC